MRIVDFLPENFLDIQAHLERGDPVIFPTESSYGFSGRLDNPRVVGRVERIKKRQGKAFLCLVDSYQKMSILADISNISEDLIEESEKTPTTFLLPKSQKFLEKYPEFFPEFERIGIRKALYKPLQGFLAFYQKPVFSTSVNFSGEAPLFTEAKVREKFSQYRDILFVSAGDLPENSPSQIFYVENSGVKKIR